MATFGKNIFYKPNKAGRYPVYLRVTHNRKTKRIKSSVELKKTKDWNPKKQEVRPSDPDFKILNEKLDKELSRLKEAYEELADKGIATEETVMYVVKQGDSANMASASFLEYAKKRTQEIYDAGQYRNYKKYNGFCNKLEGFLKKSKLQDLLVKDITPSFVAKFDAYLHTLPNERQPEKVLHPNTIEVVLNIFKTLVKRAIEIDRIMDFSDNPFLTYKYHGVKTHKEKLDEGEIQSILDLELEPYSLEWHSRNYFMFSFYCAGIRAGDLIQLRWCNIIGGRINYEMGKNHKNRDLILVPQAKAILELYNVGQHKPTDYIFPLLDNDAPWASAITQAEKDVLNKDVKMLMLRTISTKNALINKGLGKIAKEVGLSKNLSFHISRHSFARVAKEKGVDNNHVKSLLAHSSLKITENYMGNFDTISNDHALESIFEQESEDEKRKKELLNRLQALPIETLETLVKETAN